MSYSVVVPIVQQRNLYPIPVSALAFDPVSDCLWAGSSTGSAAAYHGRTRLRGVYFPVGDGRSVKKIAAGDTQVRALSDPGMGLGAWSKGGANKWYFRPPSASIVTFASHPNNSHSLASSTNTPELLMHNTSTGNIIRTLPSPAQISHLHFSHSLLISGSADGVLRTHDTRTGMRRDEGAAGEHSVKAHLGGVQDIDTAGNFVYSIGWSLRQSHPVTDQIIKVYDLRMFRPLTPIPFLAGPAFINVHPRRPSILLVASTSGLVNVIDVLNPGTVTPEFYQLTAATYLSSSAISPSGEYVAFGDADGTIHLLGSSADDEMHPFNGFDGQPIEWADPHEPLPDIHWTDSTPLNSIGMPFYESMLLSANTRDLYHPSSSSFSPAPRIPVQVLNTMKTIDFIGYASLPKELRGKRNVVYGGSKSREGRFRSSKPSKNNLGSSSTHFSEIPSAYRRVEIEYSKFGVEDFDFAFYNNTSYSGLETHILGSYTNALLQTLHYTIPIRKLAKSHITTPCQREHCLLCELGFVVRMLEDAQGINCQAANFCRTISALPQASQMSVIDYGRETVDVDYVSKIQTFNRFMLEQFISEGNVFPHNPRIVPHGNQSSTTGDFITPAPAPITQLFGIDAKSIIICGNCGARRDKEGLAHVVEMLYPKKTLSNETPPPSDFASILRNALVRDMSYRATCQTCKQLAPQRSRRFIPSSELPPVLAVNACVYTEDHLQYWLDTKNGRFLSPMVAIRPGTDVNQPGGIVEGVDDPNAVVYELRSIIIAVKEKATHLIAIVKIPEEELLKSEIGSSWYIFNDFVVQNISEEEALSFTGNWKIPAILYLERVNVRSKLDYTGLPEVTDPAILSRDSNISMARDKSLIKHETLRFEELPTPGTLIAIDAEFVLMQQDETEYRSDGTKKMIRPSRYGLARVSVLRGDGPKQGVPFIDDYIHTSESIVDYLTAYSGIRYGDLDPQVSEYTLVPLKVAYKKLRLLVDLGCIFIGHGLSKDFRTINIFVPADQVIDTVDLYFLPEGRRKLSLRFLSWFILGEDIQTETHDSIEDARSALMLFKAYHEFEGKGVWEEKLEELYREGRRCNFKPPTPETPVPSTSPPPHSFTPMSSLQINPSNTFNFLQSQFGSTQRHTFGPNTSPPASSSFFPTFRAFTQPSQPYHTHSQQQSWRPR